MNDILKDCEKIIKEINIKGNLKIKFITSNDNSFVKKKQLFIYDSEGKIIVIKEYAGGPSDFEINYKNGKFIK